MFPYVIAVNLQNHYTHTHNIITTYNNSPYMTTTSAELYSWRQHTDNLTVEKVNKWAEHKEIKQ